MRARRRAAPLLALIAGALATACAVSGPAGPDDGVAADALAAARARWGAAGLDSYRYTLGRSCFCVGEAVGPAVVTVVDGAVASVTRPAGVEGAVEGEHYPSVEGLFDLIEDALERGAARIDVTYDPDLGVPLRVWIDYLENAVDEELGFEAGLPEPLG